MSTFAYVLFGKWKGERVQVLGKVPDYNPEAWFVKIKGFVIIFHADELRFVDEP
jgi:hypothetical protein